MISKKEIIEMYLGDLRNIVTDSPAKKQRIALLLDELEEIEQVENNDTLPIVINCTCDEPVSDKEYVDCCGKCGYKIKE